MVMLCAMFACFAVPTQFIKAADEGVPTNSPAPTATAAPSNSPAPTTTPAPEVSFKTAFPDGNFRGIINEKILTKDLNDSDILSQEAIDELKAYTGDLDVSNQNITDLTGVSYLENITELIADGNGLQNLVLSDMDKLESITVSHNKLSVVTLSKLPKLKNINVDYNNLLVLDVSELTSLEGISCARNSIAALNLSQLKELTTLDISNNIFTTLDISVNTKLNYLNIENNKLTTIDLSKCKQLEYFYGDGNEILSMDKTGLADIKFKCFELRKSNVTLIASEVGIQDGVILPVGAMTPIIATISNSGSYLTATRSIVWSSLTTLPSSFTYQYTIGGTNDVVTVTVNVDKTTLLKSALYVDVPMNFTSAVSAYNKIKLSWTPVNGSSGYRIYRSTSKTGTYTLIKTITSGATSTYTNSSLDCGTTYYYKIRAFRQVNSVKYFGNYAAVISRKAVPAKPTLTLSKYSSSKIKLSWNKITGSSGYALYRATSSTGTYTKIATIKSGSTVKYINTKRKKGTTYYYKMRAYRVVNGVNVYGPYSAVKSRKL